jgi:hypothetical protein
MKTEENRTPITIFIEWFKYEQEHYGTPTPENIIKQAENLKITERENFIDSFFEGKKFADKKQFAPLSSLDIAIKWFFVKFGY